MQISDESLPVQILWDIIGWYGKILFGTANNKYSKSMAVT